MEDLIYSDAAEVLAIVAICPTLALTCQRLYSYPYCAGVLSLCKILKGQNSLIKNAVHDDLAKLGAGINNDFYLLRMPALGEYAILAKEYFAIIAPLFDPSEDRMFANQDIPRLTGPVHISEYIPGIIPPFNLGSYNKLIIEFDDSLTLALISLRQDDIIGRRNTERAFGIYFRP